MVKLINDVASLVRDLKTLGADFKMLQIYVTIDDERNLIMLYVENFRKDMVDAFRELGYKMSVAYDCEDERYAAVIKFYAD